VGDAFRCQNALLLTFRKESQVAHLNILEFFVDLDEKTVWSQCLGVLPATTRGFQLIAGITWKSKPEIE
jgi:hypothetical protein